jgi:hypothetical protein
MVGGCNIPFINPRLEDSSYTLIQRACRNPACNVTQIMTLLQSMLK